MLKMIKTIKKYLKKYQHIIAYLIFGGLTTLVNLLVYYGCAHIVGMGVVPSTFVAWFVAVLFAYVTNRKWVFHSNAKTKKAIMKELLSFFECRIATGIIDMLMMFIFVDICHFNDLIVKIGGNVIVIILNYIFSKLIVFNQKESKYDWGKIFGIFIALFVLTFLVLLNSPINIWQSKSIFIDQGVFETIGMMMRKGYMPYRDTFDHKGPLIYIYNYLGHIIKYYKGIWYIEFASLLFTFIFVYKIARLKCNRLISVLITMASSITLFKFFEQGNLVEEYALPFITIATYIFLDYYLNKKINKFRLIVCGFSLGGALLLRPNMIGLWLVFCSAILIDCLKEKKYKELKEFIIYFMLGLLIIVLPIIIWLGINNSLSDFWQQYVIFNFKYSRVSEHGVGLKAKLTALVYFTIYITTIISIIVEVVLYFIDKKKIDLVYLIYIIVVVLLNSISGNCYGHYGMVLMPIIVYPLMNSLVHSNKMVRYAAITVFVYLLVVFFAPNVFKVVSKIPNMYKHRNEDGQSMYVNRVVKVIEDNTSTDDKISVYGNINVLYVVSKRAHATKYSYLYPITKFDPKIENEYFKELAEEKPKVIVVIFWQNDEKIQKFLKDNKYEKVYEDGYFAYAYILGE